MERLQGFRCLKQVRKLLGHLHKHRDCPNRKLHYDEYATILLFGTLLRFWRFWALLGTATNYARGG